MKWNSEAKECQVGVPEFRKGSCTEYFASLLEHKTFALAINRDYFRTVFTSDHPCPEYIVYSQYTGGLWRNQHQKQKMARPINREGTYFMLY